MGERGAVQAGGAGGGVGVVGLAIRLWDMNHDGGVRLLSVMASHSGYVNAVAVSSDDSLCASGGLDGTAVLWELGEGTAIHCLAASITGVGDGCCGRTSIWTARREPGKTGSHFHPESDVFAPSDMLDVITSTICWGVMVTLLAGLCFVFGPIPLLKLYGVPYTVFVMWLDFAVYLQHHGQGEEKLPWYRGKEWNYLRGALTTLDRDYGVFNNIHHNIGTHVIHHLFPQIPHYHLIEATNAAKPVLGKYYKEPKRSAGPFPFHLIGSFLKSLRMDHFVGDSGDIVYFQTDPSLTAFGASKSSKLAP